MCGILAYIGEKNGSFKVDIKNALDIISHRGPDDFGVEEFGNVMLAFRRLSIIDLSHNGHQPMADSSKRYWIVFNGEIYNHNELKSALINEGVEFNSSSDTETILYAYIKYGSAVVAKLDGMFAFVIFDKITKDVFVARDRMGKKPLLYYKSQDKLLFFSELKQIISFSFFEKKINPEAVSLYLAYGSIPAPITIFENVFQLEAGHYATVRDGCISKTEYWKPTISINDTLSYEDALTQTHDLVTKSIRKRLVSDVPLGAFLSGGIDSSIITAVMANHSSNVQTFSINYSDAPDSYDESYFADLIVNRYQTTHSVITISPDDIYQDIDRIVWHMDQPTGDAINTYFVSKSARTGVTVALSGVGADEIFAGYSTFKFAEALARIRAPRKVRNSGVPFIDRLFYKLPASLQVNWKVRMLAGSLGAFPTALDRYNLVREIYRKDEIARILTIEPIANRQKDFLEQFFSTSFSTIQQITMAEVNNYLKSTLLRDSDVMGMAKSLEIRSPFIDHTLIDFALTIPDHFKIKNLNTKILLKDAFKSYLPEEVVKRKKMGFAFPLSAWLKTGDLKALVEDCLSPTSVARRNLFDYDEVQNIKNAYFSLNKNTVQTYQSYQKVWLLVILEMWFRKYVD